jgi:PadR family transcriptional regulator PadR
METPLTAKGAILQALIAGPAFGMEVIERVSKKTRGKIRLHQGSAYPALRALEREGLVRSWEGPQEEIRAGRPRRYYELTADGLRTARGQREMLLGFFRPETAR